MKEEDHPITFVKKENMALPGHKIQNVTDQWDTAYKNHEYCIQSRYGHCETFLKPTYPNLLILRVYCQYLTASPSF